MRIDYEDNQLDIIDKVNAELEPYGLRFEDDGKRRDAFCIFDLVSNGIPSAEDLAKMADSGIRGARRGAALREQHQQADGDVSGQVDSIATTSLPPDATISARLYNPKPSAAPNHSGGDK